MITRILTVLILAPLVIAGVFYATPRNFLLAIGIGGTLLLFEYFRISQFMGLRAQPWLGYISMWTLFIGFHEKLAPPIALISAVIIAAFLAAMWRNLPMKDRVLGMMTNLLGILYVTACLYPAILVRYEFGSSLGVKWTMILFAAIWSGDSAAMIVGKKFGRTLFAPSLSPKKTNEGAMGGLIASIAVAAILQRFWCRELPLHHVVIASSLLGAFGQMGDLAESMLKRAAQIKDSSNMIPGHGGVLDRMDSMLFAFPVLYIYLSFLYRP